MSSLPIPAQKGIAFVALLLTLLLIVSIPPLKELTLTIGASIGEALYSDTLNNVLRGYTDPPTSVWHTIAFIWSWVIALISMSIYYLLIDSVSGAKIQTWVMYILGSGLVSALIGFFVLNNQRSTLPVLEEVSGLELIIWCFVLFLVTALLAILQSMVLRKASQNSPLVPFG